MHELNRVVVTGMGAITPIGKSVDEFWAGIKAGCVGIGDITRFDLTNYKARVAAEVKDFNPVDYMEFRVAKRMGLFSQYAIAAAGEAIKDSGLDLEKEDKTRIGTCIGSGIGSLQIIEQEYKKILEGNPGQVNIFMIPILISNMAAGNVALAWGLEGKSTNVVTACATGTHSIGEAFRSLQLGDADVMVSGGCEAPINEIGVAGFTALSALSLATDHARASIPFDKERNGFVIGEGAGIVVLETLKHALARDARILGEVVGYGATCDAHHITAPREDGKGAIKAMQLAIENAGIEPSAVDYINAHGTSTKHNDRIETMAIKNLFGEHAYKLKVNSTKSMVGHMLGAAGAVEFITCVKSIAEDYIHPTVGYMIPDEDMDLDYVLKPVVGSGVNYALSNSFGFGGHNASLLVKKFEG